jgi:hypothetical protein
MSVVTAVPVTVLRTAPAVVGARPTPIAVPALLVPAVAVPTGALVVPPAAVAIATAGPVVVLRPCDMAAGAILLLLEDAPLPGRIAAIRPEASVQAVDLPLLLLQSARLPAGELTVLATVPNTRPLLRLSTIHPIFEAARRSPVLAASAALVEAFAAVATLGLGRARQPKRRHGRERNRKLPIPHFDVSSVSTAESSSDCEEHPRAGMLNPR